MTSPSCHFCNDAGTVANAVTLPDGREVWVRVPCPECDRGSAMLGAVGYLGALALFGLLCYRMWWALAHGCATVC